MKVQYMGRMIEREGFRAYVYAGNNSKLLANDWDEFNRLIATGLWFESKDKIPKPKKRSRRRVTKDANSSGIHTPSVQTD